MRVAGLLLRESRQLGLQEILQKGRQEGLLEATRKMLSVGVDIRVVARAIGLSRQKVVALRAK